jgi:hypothetical protein
MRTVLYYPYVEVPTSGAWIRRALLYWDRVAAIVPRSYGFDRRPDARFNPELQTLLQEGAFRAIDPMFMVQKQLQFRRELFDAIDLFERVHARRTTPLAYVPVYKDKSSQEVMQRLRQTGLVQEARDPHVVFMEAELAKLYMCALAKHVAFSEEDFTVPGTDDPSYMDLGHGAVQRRRMEPVISVKFQDLIPVPGDKVPLERILRFKERYQPELASFRSVMDEYDNRIARAEDEQHVKHEAQSLRDAMQSDIRALGSAMRDSRMDLFWGSLQSFIKPTTPTLFGAGLVAAGVAATIATLPIAAVAIGAGAGGVIQLGQHIQANLVQRRQTRSRHPFAYVFLAKKKFSAAGRK